MSLTPESITNDDIVNVFEQASIEFAQMISKLHDYQGQFESIEHCTEDNGDPSYTTFEAINALANALASCVIYCSEYKKDPYINPLLTKKDEKKLKN